MNAFDYFFEQSKDLDKNFVSGPKETATFRDVYEESLQVASFLNLEVGQEQNILLIGLNSVFFIVTYLGILKSGNVCIPLNPQIEPSNLAYIIQETNCRCAFVSDKISTKTNLPNLRIIGETELKHIVRGQRETGFPSYFNDDRTAEIIFTSGSTDTPKGVMLSHKNLCSNTGSIVQYLKLTSSDVVGVVLPFFYCFGLSLLHTHLRVGGSIVLCSNFMFLGSVINELKSYKCTGFAGVPSHFQILLRKSQTFTKTEFPHLKYVTQAGGKLHDVFIQEFTKAFPNISFFVMYGQTEATARLAYLPPERLLDKLGSIGKGISGVILRVVNDQCKPVKPGEIGEIVARGDNIMKGYFNDPITTGEVLKDGWLFTGDLAKTDDDGFIYLVGRKKEILKVGGRRVSPKEIEQVILSVHDVVDCTIEGFYDEILGEGIKANVVPRRGSNREQLRQEILLMCGQKLCAYKAPRVICFEEEMNVNAAGKKVKSITI